MPIRPYPGHQTDILPYKTTLRAAQPIGSRLTVPSRKPSWQDRYRTGAIPACNEAEYLPRCLRALAGQDTLPPHRVVLMINNTTDQSVDTARSLRPSLPFDLTLVEQCYSPAQASAGRARRDAMACAAALSPADAILFTTDADAIVRSDWIAQSLSAFERYDVDAVFGRAFLDPADIALIPAHLHADDDAELRYGALLEHMATLLDPDPHDPWPRHAEHSGASIAVTMAAWQRAGGIPDIRTGEDRAFYASLRRAGLRIRHAPDVVVHVSGRLVGRATGGMAETIARRIQAQDAHVDDALESVSCRVHRIRRRLAYRTHLAAAAPSLDQVEFEALWAREEARAPDLQPKLLARADLECETRRALRLLAWLQTRQMHVQDDPADIPAASPVLSGASRPVGIPG
ncbi:glycosyltransferase [Tanticharoenia sakaeratensis]|uniref:Glycosyl transferase n=1 Tax=Tanticharoenia sakaeratensis NBRC 103193 TaxID=1231623 RepID=A0A0D6MQI4_9PROT|nr:glycosyltransferase [Tanticharoenia sakaeratensis]GAN55665.1 glycosyl transferase [Tanticharoenia sakaeratensis NBRC 103193]GBQ19539.1 glycosyltransferase [Tanticharoenia sakaeratensis NBRC 103193]